MTPEWHPAMDWVRSSRKLAMPAKNKNRTFGTIILKGVNPVTSFRRKDTGKWQTATYNGAYFPITRRIGKQSSIKYETGRGGVFRPCTHDTTEYRPVPVVDRVYLWNSSSFGGSNAQAPGVQVGGYPPYAHQRYYANFLTGVSSVSTPTDAIPWNALSDVALASMLPSFGGQNSLVNFILELKDFRRLMAALSSRANPALFKLQALLGSNSRSDKPLKRLSKGFLQYQFGWKPLMSDLTSMWTTLSRFNERFERLKAEANTDMQAHYSGQVVGTAVSETTSFDSGEQFPPGYSTEYSGFTIRSRVTLEKSDGVEYHATLRYRYPLPAELTEASGKVKAFLDALGVAKDPAILWNAIPFSFLVDWVVNVGGWLSRLRIDNIRFQTEIREFCHSAVFTRNIRYDIRVRDGLSTSNNTHVYLPSEWITTDICKRRRYVRRVGYPQFGTAIQTSGLNPREFLLGGALVGANARLRRR